jgi:hypothetical protein
MHDPRTRPTRTVRQATAISVANSAGDPADPTATSRHRLEKLASAGHRDVEELTYYGLAYLRILQEGPDPRYSNC